MDFEWDENKANSNLAKHGLSFADATTVFGDPLAITFVDPDHSGAEDRYISIGTTKSHILTTVAHVYRNGKIRIISARRSSVKERKSYGSNQ